MGKPVYTTWSEAVVFGIIWDGQAGLSMADLVKKYGKSRIGIRTLLVHAGVIDQAGSKENVPPTIVPENHRPATKFTPVLKVDIRTGEVVINKLSDYL